MSESEVLNWYILLDGIEQNIEVEYSFGPTVYTSFGYSAISSLSIVPNGNYYDCNGNCLNDVDGDLICDEFEVLGCVDELACNYNANVTDDDGSCEYESCASCADDDDAISALGGCAGAIALFGCDFVFAGVPIGDSCQLTCGNCIEGSEPVLGCTNEDAANYDPSATEDDGTCIILGCTNGDEFYVIGFQLEMSDCLYYECVALDEWIFVDNCEESCDTVYVEAGHKTGYYIVRDAMNKRFKKKIDFLESVGTSAYRYENATLYINS